MKFGIILAYPAFAAARLYRAAKLFRPLNMVINAF